MIALSGPALHALPGFGHGSAEAFTENAGTPEFSIQDGGSAHDCPVCHFLAQGQLLAKAESAPCSQTVERQAVGDFQSHPPRIAARLNFPRAPPSKTA
jgi:hypothetical protein